MSIWSLTTLGHATEQFPKRSMFSVKAIWSSVTHPWSFWWDPCCYLGAKEQAKASACPMAQFRVETLSVVTVGLGSMTSQGLSNEDVRHAGKPPMLQKRRTCPLDFASSGKASRLPCWRAHVLGLRPPPSVRAQEYRQRNCAGGSKWQATRSVHKVSV